MNESDLNDKLKKGNVLVSVTGLNNEDTDKVKSVIKAIVDAFISGEIKIDASYHLPGVHNSD